MEPGEALYSVKLGRFIKSAREQFDYIVIDAPPVGAVDDAAALFRHVDSILYVVRAGRTPSDVAATTVNLLRARNAKIAGLVIVGADADERDSYRSHYYRQYRSPKAKPAPAARMKLNFGRSR
jgi:Mrp family chromosome partitioning ATPase